MDHTEKFMNNSDLRIILLIINWELKQSFSKQSALCLSQKS